VGSGARLHSVGERSAGRVAVDRTIPGVVVHTIALSSKEPLVRPAPAGDVRSARAVDVEIPSSDAIARLQPMPAPGFAGLDADRRGSSGHNDPGSSMSDVWLVFVSSLDIMLTWAILRRGGEEVNPVAKLVIEMWGLHGAIGFKFALMLFVIISCEVIGRRSDAAGRRLAIAAVAISAFPVVWSLGLLFDHLILRPAG
jgi:hypothetical protein